MQAIRDTMPSPGAWTIRADIPAGLNAPAQARKALEPLLDDLDSRAASAIALVASELVTNSVMHGAAGDGSVIELEATLDRDRVRLVVRDHGHGFDPAGSSDGRLGGWGLHVIDELVERWWIEVNDGTRVTCEFSA